MKTSKTPYSPSNGQNSAKIKESMVIRSSSTSQSRSPRSGLSGPRVHQLPINFKPGDMSVASNDLKGTPSGIMRLQDVKFSSSHVAAKLPLSGTDNSSKVTSGSNSAQEKRTENTSQGNRVEAFQTEQISDQIFSNQVTSEQPRPRESSNPYEGVSGVEKTERALQNYNDKQSSLKARFQGNPLQISPQATKLGPEELTTFTKQQIKELKALNKNREIFQMMGRTQTTDIKQYTRFGAKTKAKVRKESQQGSRSGSRGLQNQSVTSESSKGLKFGETIRSTTSRMSQNSSSLFSTQKVRKNYSKDKQRKEKFNMYYSNNNDAISGISKHSKMEGLGGISSNEDDALSNMILNVEVKTSETHRRVNTNKVSTRSNKSQSPNPQKLYTIRKSTSRVRKKLQRQVQSSLKKDRQINGSTSYGDRNEPNANNRDLDFTGMSSARNKDSRIKLAPIQIDKNIKNGLSTTKHGQSYTSMAGFESKTRTSVPSAMNFNKQLNEKSQSNLNMSASNEDQQAQEIIKKYAGLGGQLYIDKSNTQRDFKHKAKTKPNHLLSPSQQSPTHKRIPSIEVNKEESEHSAQFSNAMSQSQQSFSLLKGSQSAMQQKKQAIQNLKLNTDSTKEFQRIMHLQVKNESDKKFREPDSGNNVVQSPSSVKQSEVQAKDNIQLSDNSSEKGNQQFIESQPITSPQSVHFLASESPEIAAAPSQRRLKSRGQSLKKLTKISKKVKHAYEAEPQSGSKVKGQKNNEYKNTESVYMKPGQQFAQSDHVPPSKIIDGIKKQIELMKKDNRQFTTMIETNDNKFTAQNKNIAETKKKSAQAKSDKKELFRDLATYESKFNESSSLLSRMEEILIKAQKTKTIINKNINLVDIDDDFDGQNYNKIDEIIDKELNNKNLMDKISVSISENKKMIGMLSDIQINQIHTNLRDLRNVRRNRALTVNSSLEMAGIADQLNFKKSANGIGAPQGLALLSSRAKKRSARKLTVQSQSQILSITPSAQEECNIQITISGMRAVVQARFQNGVIKGLISCLVFTKGLKFDMPPTETMKTHIDVLQEIKRLYFGLKKTKQGKNQIQLQFKESIEDAEKIKSQMLKIRGANSKQVNVEITKLAQGRHGYKVSLKLKDQVLTEEISEKEIMKFKQSQRESDKALIRQLSLGGQDINSSQNFNKIIANLLEKHYVIIHRITGNYQFLHEDLAQSIYKQDAELIHKKYKNKSSIYSKRTTSFSPTPNIAHDLVSPYFNQSKESEFESQQSESKLGSMHKISETHSLIKSKLQTNNEKINKFKQLLLRDRDNHLQVFFPNLLNDIKDQHESHSKLQHSPTHMVESTQSIEEFKDNLRAFQAKILNQPVKQLQQLQRENRRSNSIELQRQPPLILNEQPQELQPIDIVYNNKALLRVVCQDYWLYDFDFKHKWILYFKSFLMGLRLRKRQQEEIKALKKDNNELEFYDMFYGPRQLRSRKKFEQYKQFKEKQKALEEQKEEDMVEIIQDFFQDLNTKAQMKDRVTESKNKTTKRKYIRQPKIYQNNYIEELMDNFPDYEEFRKVDKAVCSPEFTIHFMFLKEKREWFMMLGRSETPQESQDSSMQSGSDSPESSGGQSVEMSSNELNSNEEVDDDSPYFVKITLDQQFLSYLEEPELFTGQDVKGNYQLILENKIFKEIVKAEFELMFGVDSKKKEGELDNGQEEDQHLENKSLSAESKSLSSEESKSGERQKEPQAPKVINEQQMPESPKADGIQNPTQGSASMVIAQGQLSQAIQGKNSSNMLPTGSSIKGKSDNKKPIQLEQKLQGMVTNFSWILNFK